MKTYGMPCELWIASHKPRSSATSATSLCAELLSLRGAEATSDRTLKMGECISSNASLLLLLSDEERLQWQHGGYRWHAMDKSTIIIQARFAKGEHLFLEVRAL